MVGEMVKSLIIVVKRNLRACVGLYAPRLAVYEGCALYALNYIRTLCLCYADVSIFETESRDFFANFFIK